MDGLGRSALGREKRFRKVRRSLCARRNDRTAHVWYVNGLGSTASTDESRIVISPPRAVRSTVQKICGIGLCRGTGWSLLSASRTASRRRHGEKGLMRRCFQPVASCGVCAFAESSSSLRCHVLLKCSTTSKQRQRRRRQHHHRRRHVSSTYLSPPPLSLQISLLRRHLRVA